MRWERRKVYDFENNELYWQYRCYVSFRESQGEHFVFEIQQTMEESCNSLVCYLRWREVWFKLVEAPKDNLVEAMEYCRRLGNSLFDCKLTDSHVIEGDEDE